MSGVKFADVVATSDAVAATRARSQKIAAFAELFRRLEPLELGVAIGLLTGEPRQGRIGVGWATVAKLDVPPAGEPTLEVLDVDTALSELAVIGGPGSQAQRNATLTDLYRRATKTEQWFLGRLLVGELRQGALAGVITGAVSKGMDVPLDTVRRAVMLDGDLARVAVIARRDGAEGLRAVELTLLRPIQPMLAQIAADVAEALRLVGGRAGGPASVEWKLDGVRIQIHRRGDDVRIWTRNLNEITERLPGIVALVRSLPVDRIVLDGEAIGWGGEGELPGRFQDTMSRLGRHAGPGDGADAGAGAGSGGDAAIGLESRFFDCLHIDGEDLLDRPLTERLDVLERVAAPWRIPGQITDDPEVARAVYDEALAAGHEGVMVKAAGSPYEAGRRGGVWRKVKPVAAFDLVVLAVEWGTGRREGWLSNLWLGARDPDGGPFVMVGKTFKGMTDELLAWQTEELPRIALAPDRQDDPRVVRVRPEKVVEIGLDGVQRSTRYPGGVALRFARVKRYRPDKDPSEADTIDAVRTLL
jgi:DNA ligase-1